MRKDLLKEWMVNFSTSHLRTELSWWVHRWPGEQRWRFLPYWPFLVEVDASPVAPLGLRSQEKESSTEVPMEEALALCSGSFPTDREEEGEEEEFGDFQLVSKENGFASDEDEHSDSNDEELALDLEDDEEELLKSLRR